MIVLLLYEKGRARKHTEDFYAASRGWAWKSPCGFEVSLGYSYKLARSLLDGLFQGIKTSPSNAHTLSGLVASMKSCKIAPGQTEYTGDIHSLPTLEQVVKQLPFPFQTKWAKNAKRILQNWRGPKFGYVTELASSIARIDWGLFGHLAGSQRVTQSVVTLQKGQKVATPIQATGQAKWDWAARD